MLFWLLHANIWQKDAIRAISIDPAFCLTFQVILDFFKQPGGSMEYLNQLGIESFLNIRNQSMPDKIPVDVNRSIGFILPVILSTCPQEGQNFIFAAFQ